MKIFIKHMVSLRCKMKVKDALDLLGIGYGVVDLGEVEIKTDLNPVQLTQLKEVLATSGLALMDDGKAILIERIKNVIVSLIHQESDCPKVRNSGYIGARLGYDYTYLANIFSENTGVTIEHYIIKHKIERAKELLVDDELNLTEISYKLNYSSVAHLSTQFKKITGLTPTIFKNLRHHKRLSLEDV